VAIARRLPPRLGIEWRGLDVGEERVCAVLDLEGGRRNGELRFDAQLVLPVVRDGVLADDPAGG